MLCLTSGKELLTVLEDVGDKTIIKEGWEKKSVVERLSTPDNEIDVERLS